MPTAPSRPDRKSLVPLTDVELAARFQDGSEDALQVLLDRYRRFARAKARSYFLVGADGDDVEQEALIGLYKAARDYRPGHEASFRAFADLCITRQIITAIKAANRQKHQALNQYVSISAPRHDGEDTSAVEDRIHLDQPVADPAEHVVADERFGAMRARMGEVLSPFEIEVLAHYVDGRSYQEIGTHLGRHAKAVDNAVQRIKRKVELTLDERQRAERDDDLALTA
ncbi:MAG: RNA polymerase sporulation sigma factor SigH [Actinomycetota bacterium]|nr:RNA polymerase sporulation sigma factor SigH [Actinomycetota bacterium]